MKSLNTMHFKFSKSTGKWPTNCVTVFMYFYSAGAVVMHREKSLHPQAPSTPVSNTVDILGNICIVYIPGNIKGQTSCRFTETGFYIVNFMDVYVLDVAPTHEHVTPFASIISS